MWKVSLLAIHVSVRQREYETHMYIIYIMHTLTFAYLSEFFPKNIYEIKEIDKNLFRETKFLNYIQNIVLKFYNAFLCVIILYIENDNKIIIKMDQLPHF